MKVFIGADHRGFAAKNELAGELEKKSYEVFDMGPYKLDPDDDYPIYAQKVAQAVVENPGSMGLLVCRSGEGMAIAANKVRGIRAIETNDKHQAFESRQDNDSNVLSLSSEELSQRKMLEVTETWLKTPFSGLARHKRRIEEIAEMEKGKSL